MSAERRGRGEGWIDRGRGGETRGGGTHSFFFVMIWEAACHFMEIKLRQTQLRTVWESASGPDRPERGPGKKRKGLK